MIQDIKSNPAKVVIKGWIINIYLISLANVSKIDRFMYMDLGGKYKKDFNTRYKLRRPFVIKPLRLLQLK